MASESHPSVAPSRKPRLLDQVRHEMRVRHMALSRERVHVNWIRRFILFHHKRYPAEMGKADVSAFLTHLAVDGKVTSSTQNQALSALLFLYRHVLEQEFGWLEDVVRAKRPGHVPVVRTPPGHVRFDRPASVRPGALSTDANCRCPGPLTWLSLPQAQTHQQVAQRRRTTRRVR